jgi:hypothetical protein
MHDQAAAELGDHGRVRRAEDPPDELWLRRLRGASAPTLAYGKQISYGRFRCLSLGSGVWCIVIQTGKGFLINRDGVTRVSS